MRFASSSIGKFLIAIFVFLFMSHFYIYAAQTASALAEATAEVIASIAIQKNSDLSFGKAAAGDGSKTISAGTSENPENASFFVTGEPHKRYTVILPADGTIVMRTGQGSAHQRIAVDGFHFGTMDGALQLGAEGNQPLFVGATRNALNNNQMPGIYSATFLVTVTYE